MILQLAEQEEIIKLSLTNQVVSVHTRAFSNPLTQNAKQTTKVGVVSSVSIATTERATYNNITNIYHRSQS